MNQFFLIGNRFSVVVLLLPHGIFTFTYLLLFTHGLRTSNPISYRYNISNADHKYLASWWTESDGAKQSRDLHPSRSPTCCTLLNITERKHVSNISSPTRRRSWWTDSVASQDYFFQTGLLSDFARTTVSRADMQKKRK